MYARVGLDSQGKAACTQYLPAVQGTAVERWPVQR